MSKVSIITASYNYAEYIGQTIESVINQTFPDWEMLVIDDGSKDNSIEIINKYVQKDSRIKLITHPNNENKGLTETLRLGVYTAQGEYIVFLESDDYIRNDYLEKKLQAFQKFCDAGFIYNDIQTFGANQSFGRKMYFKSVESYWKKNNYPHNISELFYLQNYVPTFSCVMLKKHLLEHIDWSTPFQPCIDEWLWVQISKKTNFYYISEKLTFWRLHNTSYLSSLTNKDNFDRLNFHNQLYELLLPIKCNVTKIKFIIKQILLFIKYRHIKLDNLKHIVKKEDL